jgi:hypothetical protein
MPIAKCSRRDFVRGIGGVLAYPKVAALTSRTLAVLASPTIIAATAVRNPRINVADFGARPDGSADAINAVKAAIKACQTSGATLYFPHGRYLFSQKSGYVFNLNGHSGLEIDGDGSKFIFSGTVSPFALNGSRSPNLHDFSIDWDRPPFSQGTVISIARDSMTIDVKIDSEFPVTDSETIFRMRPFDRKNRVAELHVNDINPSPDKVSLVAKQTLRIHFPKPVQVGSGDSVLIRHTRDSVGIIFGNCSDIMLQRVILNTAAGMGFVGTGVNNAKFEDCAVAIPAGSDRWMSTTADGLHFWGCRGDFLVDKCNLDGVGDDCMNFHSFLLGLTRLADKRTVMLATTNKLEGRDSPLRPAHLPRMGDQVELVDGHTLLPVLRSEVAAVSGDLNATRITLASDIPVGISPQAMFLSGPVPKLTVRNSKMSKSLGCGVVAHADALIENNSFTELGWVGVNCQVDTYFREGPTISNIQIRGNTFQGCGRVLPGSIRVSAQLADANGQLHGATSMGNRNIEISGNTFDASNGVAILVGESENVTIANNRIIPTVSVGAKPAVPQVIVLSSVRSVHVDNNSVRGGGSLLVQHADSVTIENNPGLTVQR